MKLAIVGSRTFPQLDNVRWFINELPQGITVVSGGAHGVDTAAAQAARSRGLNVVEYLPQLDGLKGRHEYTKAYYTRNQQIVDASDLVIAFTEKNTGGTWDTIKRARKARKPVKVIRPKAIPGNIQQEMDQDTDSNEQAATREKGKGFDASQRAEFEALRRVPDRFVF